MKNTWGISQSVVSLDDLGMAFPLISGLALELAGELQIPSKS
jgi:hypothetical protein